MKAFALYLEYRKFNKKNYQYGTILLCTLEQGI